MNRIASLYHFKFGSINTIYYMFYLQVQEDESHKILNPFRPNVPIRFHAFCILAAYAARIQKAWNLMGTLGRNGLTRYTILTSSQWEVLCKYRCSGNLFFELYVYKFMVKILEKYLWRSSFLVKLPPCLFVCMPMSLFFEGFNVLVHNKTREAMGTRLISVVFRFLFRVPVPLFLLLVNE